MVKSMGIEIRMGGLEIKLPLTFLRLEFPQEAGLILRCAVKAGNPFQNTQGLQTYFYGLRH